MLECHCHLLPGIDDGAPDLTVGLALLGDLAAQGISEVVLTPHRGSSRVPVDDARVPVAFADFCAAALAQPASSELRLHLGAENHLSGVEDPTRWAAQVVPLGDSRVVLIELPDDQLPGSTWDAVFALQRRGFRPLLAHPERCKGLHVGDPAFERYVDSGGLLQITLGHLIGAHGWRMRWRAGRLWRRYHKACVLASDTHDRGPRRPRWNDVPLRMHSQWPHNLRFLSSW